LKRARTAIRYLLWLPPISEEDIERDLVDLFSPHERAVLRYFFRTSCFSHTMSLLGVPYQSSVMFRLHNYVTRLKQAGEEYRDYVRVFAFLLKKPKAWADSRNHLTPADLATREVVADDNFHGLPPPFKKGADPNSKWMRLSPQERRRKVERDKRWKDQNRQRVRDNNRASRLRRKAARDA